MKPSESIAAMLEAILLPPARDDYEESYDWYWDRSPRAADLFAAAIDAAIQRLRDDPSLGIKLDEEHSFYRLKKSYPFHLVYRVETTRIVVVAVAHNRREPNYWRNR